MTTTSATRSRLLGLIALSLLVACEDQDVFAPPVDVHNPAAFDSVKTPAPSAPAPAPTAAPTAGASLYLQIHTDAQRTAAAWRTNRPTDAALLEKMSRTPMAIWLGDWNSDVGAEAYAVTTAAAGSNTVPVFVLYNIPKRDCGLYSAGGASTATAYRAWIQKIANGIGNRRAMVIVEPDAVAGMECLSAGDRATRVSLIKEAVVTLKGGANTRVYIDAGNPFWNSVGETAQLLREVGVDKADGFSLNVSNFVRTADNVSYGTSVAAQIGNKHFVIDTSRNGAGPAPGAEWCNPAGRATGNAPTLNTGNALVDAYLWVKPPGESDGPCNGGPAAGEWWPDYAVGLLARGGF